MYRVRTCQKGGITYANAVTYIALESKFCYNAQIFETEHLCFVIVNAVHYRPGILKFDPSLKWNLWLSFWDIVNVVGFVIGAAA